MIMTQTNLLENTTPISQHLPNKYIKEDQYTLINPCLARSLPMVRTNGQGKGNNSNQLYTIPVASTTNEVSSEAQKKSLLRKVDNRKLYTMPVTARAHVTNQNYGALPGPAGQRQESTQSPTPQLAKKEQAFLFKISSSPLNFENIVKKLISMAGISSENGEFLSLSSNNKKFPNKFSGELGPHYNLYCFYERSEETIELRSRSPEKRETDLQSDFFVLFLSFSSNLLPNVSKRVKYLLESHLKSLFRDLTIEDCKKRKLTLDEGHIKARSLRSFRGALTRLFFKNPLLNFGKTKIIEVRGTKAQFFEVYRAAARNAKLELSYEPNLEINTLKQFVKINTLEPFLG